MFMLGCVHAHLICLYDTYFHKSKGKVDKGHHKVTKKSKKD
jgi:hypothetical protein